MEDVTLENISLQLDAAYEGLEQACGIYSNTVRLEDSINEDSDPKDTQYALESILLGTGLDTPVFSTALESKSGVRRIVDYIMAAISKMFKAIADQLKKLWDYLEDSRGTLLFRIGRAKRRLRTKIGRQPKSDYGPATMEVNPGVMYLRSGGKAIRSGGDLLQLILIAKRQVKLLDTKFMPEAIKLGGRIETALNKDTAKPEEMLTALNDAIRSFPFPAIASALSSKDHFDGQRSSKTSVKLAPAVMGDRALHIAYAPDKVDDPIEDARALRAAGVYFAEVPFNVDTTPVDIPVPPVEMLVNILDDLEELVKVQPDSNVRKQINEIKAVEKSLKKLSEKIESSGMERKYFEIILRSAGRYPELSVRPMERLVRHTVVAADSILTFCNNAEKMYR